jgi:transposase
VFAIRSERRICAEIQVNLAYRWFCKLGIEDKLPDHSVFCRARHERFRESDALRRVFEGVVAMCIAAGLVGGEAAGGNYMRVFRAAVGRLETLIWARAGHHVAA